ncbi:hypothetical protein MMC14_000952 [Varicellaria rhodocarpa]|nr:hypothetical protein [Varicellaria rhodocarpa]
MDPDLLKASASVSSTFDRLQETVQRGLVQQAEYMRIKKRELSLQEKAIEGTVAVATQTLLEQHAEKDENWLLGALETTQ